MCEAEIEAHFDLVLLLERHGGQISADLAMLRTAVDELDAANPIVAMLADYPSLQPFFEHGTLRDFPINPQTERDLAGLLVSLFDAGSSYSEGEVNEILSTVHPDYATLRRRLVDLGMVTRTPYGGYRAIRTAPGGRTRKSGRTDWRYARLRAMATMRAIWKGSMSLGLVGVPVKLYTATEEKNLRFHQVHAADGGRVQMRRVCSADGAEVPYAEIGKGIEVDGEMVILTDEDFDEVPLPTAKTINVLEFVPAEQVDPILFDKAYYVAPDGAAALKPYLLIREALARADRVGIVKVALRQREHLAAMRVRDDVIVLSVMLWPDEVREPEFDFVDKEAKIRPQERTMAEALVESMAGDFDPSEHTDEYRQAVQELVEAKLAGETLTVKAEKPTKAADLLAVLSASVEAAREGRTRPAAKKAAAKKAALAKKTTRKKAA